jgi:hypothetical protein
MLTTPHVLAGTAIGVAVGNPVAGFALGVASHYLLDAVPHSDPGTWHYLEDFKTFKMNYIDYIVGFGDLFLIAGILLLINRVNPIFYPAAIAGGIGGMFPDIVVYLGVAFRGIQSWPIAEKYNGFISRFHYTARPDQLMLGIFTQFAVALISIWFILSR